MDCGGKRSATPLYPRKSLLDSQAFSCPKAVSPLRFATALQMLCDCLAQEKIPTASAFASNAFRRNESARYVSGFLQGCCRFGPVTQRRHSVVMATLGLTMKSLLNFLCIFASPHHCVNIHVMNSNLTSEHIYSYDLDITGKFNPLNNLPSYRHPAARNSPSHDRTAEDRSSG